jgi:hypothetical protein
MALTNACFISYRHVTDERIIKDLQDALTTEIKMWVSKPVFRDVGRLKGGQFFNKVLARELCESVCMIVVYIPAYFSSENPYCVREYRAMEQIERRRLQLLRGTGTSENGFIIPIVCRDWDGVPALISSRRNCYNFEPILTRGKRLKDDGQARAKIAEIARYIRDRHNELSALRRDPCRDCRTFAFPTEAAVRPWLRKAQIVKPEFPFR